MLTELCKPERKKTLKKTILKKRKPTIALGRVAETPEPTHKPYAPKPKPRSPCPQRRAVSGVSSIKKVSGGSFSSAKAKKRIQFTENVFDTSLYDNLLCIPVPTSESSVSTNPVHLIQKHLYFVPEDVGNQEKNRSLQRPQEKQPPLLNGALTLDCDLAHRRFSCPDIDVEKEK